MIDPVSTTIATEVGKGVVVGAIKRMLRRSQHIDKTLSEDFKISGREMLIKCPDSIQQYSITFEPKKKHILSKKKRFKYGNVRRVNIRPFRSLQSLTNAIELEEDGFEINLKELDSNESFILEMEYFIDDKRFIDSLVNKKVARDVPKGETNEYWIVAQLKHLKTLQQDFGYVELRDIDFGVDVSVHQDVKIKVPGIFKKQLETIVKLTKKIGRSDKFNLYKQLLSQQEQKYGGKEFDILQDLQDLFSPFTFKKYVEVEGDFYYFDCKRGKDFYDTLPFPTWPKSMGVTSRTDLNFDKPAADGTLIYKRKNFLDEIEKLF